MFEIGSRSRNDSSATDEEEVATLGQGYIHCCIAGIESSEEGKGKYPLCLVGGIVDQTARVVIDILARVDRRRFDSSRLDVSVDHLEELVIVYGSNNHIGVRHSLVLREADSRIEIGRLFH